MPTWFEATPEEQRALFELVDQVKRQLDEEFHPEGYNVGFNAGEVAGQTVMHLHVHVIPRYRTDMDDPRGGVRGVIPWKQKYQSGADERIDELLKLPKLSLGGSYRTFARMLWDGLRLADEIRLLAAFIQPSGLDELEDELIDALDRGASVRVLTGDYHHITSPDALRRLLEWQRQYERFESKLFRCDNGRAFHPKAYLFEIAGVGVGYVGSSNLSRSALGEGHEWNLRTLASWDGPEYGRARERFDELYADERSIVLSRQVIEGYERFAKVPFAPEPRGPRPVPHEIQEEALAQLAATRRDGARRAMVVMATGLGKTYLAAFDFDRMQGKRALFLAHREEILKQALTAWQRLFPERTAGLYVGDRKDAEADILFASVQSLSRRETLDSFGPKHFDYVVVDEFHHAAATTYRRVLSYFQPQFLLGLTATPDRMDGASLLSLCDDNLAFRAGLVRGITQEKLVPFHYFGVADKVDFSPIPWRSGRFDAAQLSAALETTDRAEQALEAYLERAPADDRRTLAFCCSVDHANFMAQYFREAGIAAVAVHSDRETSARRALSLRRLTDGDLEVIFAVDLFNEGLDVPDVNVVLMLRPTDSPVIFLQQLGRGLRLGKTIDKPFLTIVDFIGNHRAFLQKPQALMSLTDVNLPATVALRKLAEGEVELPPGCSVEIETEAVELLEKVANVSREDMLLYEYSTLRDSHGRRPTAGEVFASGVHLKPVHDRYGTWFDFVEAQGDLTDDERRVLERHRDWFSDIGRRARMTKSFKMVALQGLIDLGRLREGADVAALAEQCRDFLRRDSTLHVEAPEEIDPKHSATEFAAKWRTFPLEVWAEGKGESRAWFELEGGWFRPRYSVLPEDGHIFDEMTEELVDLRLRQHRSKLARKAKVSNEGAPIPVRVSHSSGKPILRIDRKRYPELPPKGEDVRVLVEGTPYLFRFQKVAVNVVMATAGGANELPRLMREWFGPSAGLPGSRHYVELVHGDQGWELQRQDADVSAEAAPIIPFPTLPFYSDLAVACGARMEQGSDPGAGAKQLPIRLPEDQAREGTFVVRAVGDSMDGGPRPIRDGDLVLCRWVSATRPEAYEGKPCLLTGYEGPDQSFAQIKVPVREGGRWILRSTNPAHADQPIDKGVTLHIAAEVLEVVEEAPAITLWGNYERKEVVELFGQHYGPSWRVGHRNFDLNGEPHTFLFVTLRKPSSTKLEHRYADRFLSPTEFQWESQATTKPDSKKGRSIIHHEHEGREIHLFCRPEPKVAFVYCGKLTYEHHTGEQPMRVWFELQNPLPRDLYRRWTGG